MRYLIKAFKAFIYFIFFLVVTLIALRFTLDINQLKPRIEKLISEQTGAETTIQSLELSGMLGVSMPLIELVFPHSPERQLEWESYDEYVKATKLAKKEGTPAPEEVKMPLPMLQLCAQQTEFTVTPSSLLSLVFGGELSGGLDSKLFDCDLSAEPLTESTPQRIHAEFSTLYQSSESPRKRSRELNFVINLNEVELRDNELIVDQSPIKVNGALSLEGRGSLSFGRRGKLLLKKSTGEVKVEITGLSTEAGHIQALELPKLKLGQFTTELKLDRGKLQIERLETKSAELDGEVTGYIQLSGALARSGLNLHIAMNMSSAFIRKTPEVKTISQLRKRYFKSNADGGYRLGVLIKGRVSKPRVSATQNSPYSKEGRRLKRQTRGAKKRVNSKLKSNQNKRSSNARAQSNKRQRDRTYRGKNKNSRRDKRAGKTRNNKSNKAKRSRPNRFKGKKGNKSKKRNRRASKKRNRDQEIDEVAEEDSAASEADFDDEDEVESEGDGEDEDEGEGEDEDEDEGEGEDDDDEEEESEDEGEEE